jgi:hypothetical protein
MRWRQDEADYIWGLWAKERQKIYGVTKLDELKGGAIVTTDRMSPSERLGKLRSTLAAVREEADGASQGKVSQNFPEVYRGQAADIHRIFMAAPEWVRDIAEAHYVFKNVLTVADKATELGLSIPQYWDRVQKLKEYTYRAMESLVEAKA